MPTLRPVGLACDHHEAPKIDVRQQPYPLNANEPEFWVTTITVGSYPNELQIVLQHATPEDGIAAAINTSTDIHRAALALLDNKVDA